MTLVSINMSMENSKIKDFFKSQTVFLTGGSGFLGKIIIEKLLRVCPDLERIYVLMRAKKGKTPEERFNELFNFACFDRLKSENASALEKVSLIIGDCQDSSMGIGDQHLDILKRETTCVIHAAANVRFDQTLKEATNNVRSTKYLLEVAKQMSKLKVFVYVSTAYSNCINSTIKEEFYNPPMKAENLFGVIDACEDEVLEFLTPTLLGKWPNTYIYTKCISEDLIKEASSNLPMVVVRPAIVVNTVDEPMSGWIDNFYGPVGLTIGSGLGIIKSVHGKLDVRTYLVPVDFVANCILASAWKRGKCGTTKIYNYVGCPENFLTLGKYKRKMDDLYWATAFEKAVWYYSFKLRENKLLHDICIFFGHTVLSYIVDFVLFCCGKPTLAVKNYRKLNKMLDLFSYFSMGDWTFKTDNVQELWSEMSDADKKYFNFDMKSLNWDRFLLNAGLGARQYLLKEPLDTIPKAQRKLKILGIIHYTIIALFYYLLYKILCFVYSLLYN